VKPAVKPRAVGSHASRRARAAESFRTAAECIGEVGPGMSLFAITRGQFSMIDAIQHCLAAAGPSAVSVWTWTLEDYEAEILAALHHDERILSGTLVIDQAARKINGSSIARWRESYGDASVRYASSHAKMATIEGGGLKILLRGSMNLNKNPRIEQLDITEGGPDFDLVRELEHDLVVLPIDANISEIVASSRTGSKPKSMEFPAFRSLKVWKK